MERKDFYDEIYEDIIRSIQEFEDDDISEQYDCLYDYILDHEDIISQYSTFDFSNERCFDKSAKRRKNFLFSRNGMAIALIILFIVASRAFKTAIYGHLYDACAKTSDIVVIKMMTSAWCLNQNTLIDLLFAVVVRN